MTNTALDYGIVGLVLITVWKFIDAMAKMYLHKQGVSADTDPLHFEMTREIHNMVENQQMGVQRGDFACVWRGRDEVRDLLESIRALTLEVRQLRQELTKTRNGGT